METSKMFKLLNNVSMKRVGEYAEGFLRMEKQMDTQSIYIQMRALLFKADK
jgi:hypothetical protein